MSRRLEGYRRIFFTLVAELALRTAIFDTIRIASAGTCRVSQPANYERHRTMRFQCFNAF